MGEIESCKLSQYPSRAKRVAVALALGRRYLAGPDVLQPPVDPPDHRSWLVRHTSVEIFTEWRDPVRSLSVWALPQDLRPGRLTPIVRRTTWELNRTKRAADKEGIFDANALVAEYFSTRPQFVSKLDERMRLLVAGVDSLHTYDSISQSIRDEASPQAITYARIEWGTRVELIDLQWAADDFPARTELFGSVWDVMDAECRESNVLTDWTPYYEVPLELAFADPDLA